MNEKRRYFRIQDCIGLAIREARVQKPILKLSTFDATEDQELKAVETELNALVNTIWGVDPKIAKSIGLLNRKIELLCEKNAATEHRTGENFDIRFHNLMVSLSAAGIAFVSDNSLQVNDRLELMLVLPPASTRIVVKGSVVDSSGFDDKDTVKYQVRIDFDLTAAEEEMLIQHIVQRQVQLIAKQNASIAR